MYIGHDFSPLTGDEIDILSFEFTADLLNRPGRAINTCTFSCKVLQTDVDATVDLTPMARLIATPTVDTWCDKITKQLRTACNVMVGTLVPGNTYAISCSAVCDDNQSVLGLWSKVYCQPIQ